MNILDVFTMYMLAESRISLLLTLCDDYSVCHYGKIFDVEDWCRKVKFSLEVVIDNVVVDDQTVCFTIPQDIDVNFENNSHGDGYIAFDVAGGYRVKVEFPDLNTQRDVINAIKKIAAEKIDAKKSSAVKSKKAA